MNTGDTAWLLISTALVLLMTPGLAFFYAGLVRERNTVNTIKMSVIAIGIVALEWAAIGYSLAFSPGTNFIGGFEFLGLESVGTEPDARFAGTVPHLIFMAFQMMFAIITPALISGAVVGRMKFKAWVAFVALWGLFVYAPLAHWVWGPGGWIRELGALDFAGGTVVHVSAGVSALVAALILGPRHHDSGQPEPETPHNVPFVVLGAALLFFGWFGFNGGSALAADGLAALAFVTTLLAAAAAIVTWVTMEAWRGRKPSAVGASIGAVVGLVTITPAAGFVSPLAAIAIGALGALVSQWILGIIRRTGLDDTLDVFACHGLGGITGALLTGVFASTAVNPAGADGWIAGNAQQIFPQLVSVMATVLLAGAGTAGILLLLDAWMGLRPTPEAEAIGLDFSEHEERAYLRDSKLGMRLPRTAPLEAPASAFGQTIDGSRASRS